MQSYYYVDIYRALNAIIKYVDMNTVFNAINNNVDNIPEE